MTNLVSLHIEDFVATITLNRPESLNAFNTEMADLWASLAMEVVSREDVRAIVIAGEGRAFCAGGDVREIAGFPHRDRQISDLATRINDGCLALIESSKPVVAAVHGTTAGGGLGILLSTDFAVAGQSVKIGSLYGGVGLSPDLSVTALLARAIGERRALQLTLQETMLGAPLALEWGLVAEVVPDEEVKQRAQAIARQWVETVPFAYGQTKRLFRSQPSRSLREQLAEEARTIGVVSVAPEAETRIAAFLSR